MSSRLIDHNDDLRLLRDRGYNIDVHEVHLVVRDVPYVTNQREVRTDGILVTELSLNGDRTIAPGRHQMRFAGECPCDVNGVPLDAIRPHPDKFAISAKLTTTYEFSNKPANGYPDYFAKVTNYVALISGPASTINPAFTPMTHRVVESEPSESPFVYLDTASARAEISMVTRKLTVDRVAIVGLGGTGSYVLDLLAKTPVHEIHLFDGDKFSSHNAFRAPGAASLAQLRAQPLKVEYFRDIYANMHRGIVPHPEYIDADNVRLLTNMSAVFLCMDAGPGKRLIVEALEHTDVTFFDTGMGLYEKRQTIGGILQVTTSTPTNRSQAKRRMSLTDASEPNEYDKNIQVADLNACNALLAVIRWKKMCGFYQGYDRANFATFTVGTSQLLNEDPYGED